MHFHEIWLHHEALSGLFAPKSGFMEGFQRVLANP
jgi:hypothetical protein